VHRPASRPAVLIACSVAACAGSCILPSSTLAAARASLATGAASTGAASTHAAASTSAAARRSASTQASDPNAPVLVGESDVPPAGRRLSSNRVLAIAARVPKIRAVRAEYRGSFAGAYLRIPFRWQVSYFSRSKKEIAQVIIDDGTGRVLEAWTGYQVAWGMARGYPGAFGRHSNSLYVWLPLCALFFLAFFDFRRVFSLLHLDLAMLLFFSVSLAFFNHAHIYASVPLAYPPLVYLLARMLALARARAGVRRPVRSLHLIVRPSWLALAVIFLIAFRIALNVSDSNVIDVGYAGVIGAQRIVDGKPMYGGWPRDNEHGDTYGPVNYAAYVPFQQALGFSGRWDDLPAAHGAAIAFDLLCVGLLFLIGRRVRGPALGIALAYAWVSYPFTLFALESNSNDELVAALVLAAILAACGRSRAAAGARGTFTALASLTKFAPLALLPVLATHDATPRSFSAHARSLMRSRVAFVLAFLLTCAAALALALAHDTPATVFDRVVSYQADRDSPFSVWGLYGLGGWQRAVQIGVVALALGLALVRGRDAVALAAACAALLIAAQLGVSHWFYLYIPWFFGAAMIALLARFSPPVSSRTGGASGPARSTQLAAALSSG
jgi:hypothetical protein